MIRRGPTTSRRRGFAGRWGRLCAVAAVVLTAAVGNVVVSPSAYASGGVVIDQDTQRRGLFAAYMRSRASGAEGLRQMFLSATMVGYRQRNPAATSQQLVQHTASMNQWYTSQLGADDLVRPTYQLMVKLLELSALHPSGAVAAPIFRELAESTLGKEVLALGETLDDIHAAQRHNSVINQVFEHQDKIWGEVAGRGAIDPTFTEAWNGYFGAKYNIVANATSDQLMADPLIGTYVNVGALLEHSQNLQDYLAEGNRQITALLNEINQRTDAANADVAAMNATLPVDGRPATQAELDQAKAKAEERKKWLEGAAGAIDLFGKLVGFADPKVGAIVTGTGRAAVQIATAVSNWLPALAANGLKAALFSASGIGMAGAVLGAIQSLVPLFGGTGPTMDQQILNELKELRQELRDFRNEMNQRFDRIELALVQLYDQMDAQFNRLLTEVWLTQDELRKVVSQLALVTERVDFWGSSILRSLQETQVSQLEGVINHRVSHAARYPETPLTWDEYKATVETLNTAASIQSKAAPFTAGLGDPNPENNLGAYGYHGSIRYLTDYAENHLNLPHQVSGGVRVQAPPTAAVEHWLLAAEGYKHMVAQNPSHAAKVNLTTDEILASGQAIQTAVRRFSAPRGWDQPEQLSPLYAKLLDDYRATGSAMVAKLHAKRNTIQNDRLGYTMFGLPNQDVEGASTAEPTAIPPCSGTATYQPSRPSNVVSKHLKEMWLADYGRTDTPAQTCYQAAWTNMSEPPDPDGEKPYAVYADLEITFRVRQKWDGQWLTAYSWSKVYPYGKIQQYYPPSDPRQGWIRNATQGMQEKWGTVKPDFEQSAPRTVDSESEIRTKTRDWLYGQAGQYYHEVVRDLTTQGNELYDLNKKLTRTALLLQSYTKLGFARSLEQDQTIGIHLFGQSRIPFDQGQLEANVVNGREGQTGGIIPERRVTAGFEQARANYCAQIVNDKCVVKPQKANEPEPNPRANRNEHVLPCTWEERWDPIERCFNWALDYRSTQLRQRLEVASERLLDEPPVPEGIPAVDELMQGIRIAEMVAKNGPTGSTARIGAVTGLDGKCLDVRSPFDDGAQIEVSACDGSDPQGWAVMPNRTVMSMGKCLDVHSGGSADGNQIILWRCHGLGSQQWLSSADGTLRNPQSGKCLTVAPDGVIVHLWTCNGGANQKWTLPA
ncbi:Ricin-type beta-trefoil lectin domain-containing protein [Micromonospora pallida]|uniref:Ricin-type beta-trefoil lectin domain-containing protein n=1 Tax=Micromonospora pallida TaxID=145854 RepID=A0A1C6T328_9ACTN|nr:ricin-type beta-trefoil lectin domain protein [Micromonospora pallida]SCL35953.1 Ricin-type beta-trefoil lectin domain-containing protein [Micromonospora pallida]